MSSGETAKAIPEAGSCGSNRLCASPLLQLRFHLLHPPRRWPGRPVRPMEPGRHRRHAVEAVEQLTDHFVIMMRVHPRYLGTTQLGHVVRGLGRATPPHLRA